MTRKFQKPKASPFASPPPKAKAASRPGRGRGRGRSRGLRKLKLAVAATTAGSEAPTVVEAVRELRRELLDCATKAQWSLWSTRVSEHHSTDDKCRCLICARVLAARRLTLRDATALVAAICALFAQRCLRGNTTGEDKTSASQSACTAAAQEARQKIHDRIQVMRWADPAVVKARLRGIVLVVPRA